MQTVYEILRQHRLLDHFFKVELSAGQLIYRSGDLVQTVYLILDGEVVTRLPTPDGGYRSRLCWGPGTLLGQIEALVAYPNQPDTFASTDAVLLGTPVADFLQMVHSCNDLCYYLACHNARGMADGFMRSLYHRPRSVRARLADYLLKNAAPDGLCQRAEDTAEVLGTTPRTVRKYLQQLQEKGAIIRRDGRVYVGDADILRQCAGRDR
ncbi:Crp/Fnr family transcriptional regulator [Neobittarella massiliensis]|uniref:Crp/Fnr family transcriptional regulator n=1 Tax=Neobittarella massiliensis (ex Bilen et al. 2018) TaxID=2041842 RepID=A0A8J6LXZ1_9FIRM|nr:Crp/Fnr family transcriptional regulator [Neobittarella massiliensis]